VWIDSTIPTRLGDPPPPPSSLALVGPVLTSVPDYVPLATLVELRRTLSRDRRAPFVQ
jgi:hypothetical protein